MGTRETIEALQREFSRDTTGLPEVTVNPASSLFDASTNTLYVNNAGNTETHMLAHAHKYFEDSSAYFKSMQNSDIVPDADIKAAYCDIAMRAIEYQMKGMK